MKGKFFRVVIPVLILVASITAAVLMIKFRPAPRKEMKKQPGVLVEVFRAVPSRYTVHVRGTGTVRARREISIVPQVSGRVVHVSPSFSDGGFFRKGELMFRIERVDYELRVEKARAALAQAEFELAREQSNATIAREEWERLRERDGAQPNPLVLYEPQLKRARAQVASARASLRQAELDLERTSVHAPFNCIVLRENIDPGQYVRAGSSVAVVAGTDRAEIVVPLPVEDLHWIHIPGRGRKGRGSPATVSMKAGDRLHVWNGRVERALGDIDPESRMSRVVVVVDDPYGFGTGDRGSRQALEMGMFVKADIEGDTIDNVFVIPRRALRDGDTVWIADGSNMLRTRHVRVYRREYDSVVISGGLSAGDRVVLTSIPGAADGLKLRIRGEDGQK